MAAAAAADADACVLVSHGFSAGLACSNCDDEARPAIGATDAG